MPWRDLTEFADRFKLDIGGFLTVGQIVGLLRAENYHVYHKIGWSCWQTLPCPMRTVTVQSFKVKDDFFLLEVISAIKEALAENDEEMIVLPREAPLFLALARLGQKWDPPQLLVSRPVVQKRRKPLERSHHLILSDWGVGAKRAVTVEPFDKEVVVNVAVVEKII